MPKVTLADRKTNPIKPFSPGDIFQHRSSKRLLMLTKNPDGNYNLLDLADGTLEYNVGYEAPHALLIDDIGADPQTYRFVPGVVIELTVEK